MRQERLSELEMLRTIGILIIVFHHLPDYTGNFYDLNYFGIPLNLSPINVLNRYFGLGIFTFVSGFLLYYTQPQLNSTGELISFLRKRVLRIFPLYLLALPLFMLTHTSLNVFETIIHILGLQVFLAPRFLEPMPTLWYVGLIVILYIFYGFLAYYTRSYRGMIFFTMAFFSLLLLIRYIFYLVEYRFFLYFFIFIAGMICCKMGLFTRSSLNIVQLFVSAFFLVAAAILLWIIRQGEENELFISQASFARIFLLTIGINILALSFTLITFTLVMKIKPYLNDKFLEFLFLISFSSYAIYLFHRPALDFITRFLRSFIYEEYWVFIISLILGLPLILILSYFAQSWNNKVIKQLPGVVQIPLLRKSDGV